MRIKTSTPIPPRLSMTAYARWVGENWKDGNLAQMKRQKDLEERIENPFRIPSDEPIHPHEGEAAGDLPGAVESDRASRNQRLLEIEL